jgi:predicted nucleic acid-binding protein
MRVVVNDANILIDLIDANLLELFFKLKFEMNISDSVVGEFENEDDVARINKFIEKGKLRLHSFSHDEMTEIVNFRLSYSSSLSIPDCSCIYLAKNLAATVLTGDRPLTNAARESGITVHGILWVFDQLIGADLMTFQTAHQRLSALMAINRRLPLSECKKRMALWKKSNP